MRKITLSRRLLAVTMGLLLSIAGAWAASVPSSSSTDYVDFSSATLTGCSLDGGYSNKYGVGSIKSATSSIVLSGVTNSTEAQYVLAFKARYNTEGKEVTVTIKFTDESDNSKEYSTETLTINSSNCTRGTDSNYMLQLTEALPEGTYTLTVSLTSNAGGSWGANFGNLVVYDPSSFNSLPRNKIDFTKYSDKSSQGGVDKSYGNDTKKYGIGSFKNGSYIKVPLINTTTQDYVLTYLWKVGNDKAQKINITLTKGDNTETFNQDFDVYNTSDAWRAAAATISSLAAGLYTMTISTTASDGSSWCPNVADLAIVPKSSYTNSTRNSVMNLSTDLTCGTITTAANKIDATKNSAAVAYLVNCIEAGTYTFSFEGATASGNNSSVTSLVCAGAGNVVGESTTHTITAASTNTWDDMHTYSQAGIILDEGLYVVFLTFATDPTSQTWCANLQNFKWTKTSPLNNIPGTSFDMAIGVTTANSNSGFKAKADNLDSNQNNSVVNYAVNTTKAGSYVLNFLMTSMNTPNSKVQFVVADENGTQISDNTVNISQTTDWGRSYANSYSVNLGALPVGRNVIKMTFTADNTWVGNVFDIQVLQALTLDETTAYTPAAGLANVSMTRSMTAGQWASFVAPFAMSAEQVSTAFGSEAKVAKLTGVSDNNLTFSNVTEIEANVPVLVKPSQAVSTITADGVTIAEGTPSQTVGTVTFTGNYSGQVNIPQNAYFIASNKLYRAADGTNTLKNFRAYFTTTGGARLSGFTFDGETTAVQSVAVSQQQAEQVYDLQGRRVSQPQKGLYIVNGKKIVVK